MRLQADVGLGLGTGMWSGFELRLGFESWWGLGLRLRFVSGLRIQVGKELVWLSREKEIPLNLQDWAQLQLDIGGSGYGDSSLGRRILHHLIFPKLR